MGDYKLSASLEGHEDDVSSTNSSKVQYLWNLYSEADDLPSQVRAVAFAGSDALISASRDATVRFWQRTPKAESGFDETIAHHGTAFVNSCAFIAPSPEHPSGLIVSGGKDTIIDVRPPGQPPESDAERLLLGHQSNVCALDVSPEPESRMIISGSWDASAMIWDVEKGEATAHLEGHQGSVWAVLIFDRKLVITGCADKQIRVFGTSGKLIRTIKGSTDVVRALCRLPQGHSAAQFASAGNDAVIRLWTIDGQEVAQLHGHENFIYSLASLPNGDLVSASEDRTMRIWRGTECIQTVTHPAISVWSVAACAETGDIATGSSDKIVRVFSRDPERQADPQVIKAFEDSVKSSAIPQQGMPQINKEQLPGPEFLQQKSGTKEGQVQMIREANGSVTAHQWSGAAQQWINVGTVVDAAGSSGRRTQYLGQDYDYVFDVDIEEGKPPLKLPYNLSQNPYEAAQKFIGDNELPISYIDQVANFIITNTQGATIGQTQEPASSAPDPWGTSARYRPGEEPAPEPPRPKVIPQQNYLTISTANFEMMFKKITEINGKLLSDGMKELTFNPDQMKVLPSLKTELDTALQSGKSVNSPVLDNGVDMAVHISTKWPPEHRIPGLDLFRCLCAATPAVVTRHDFIRLIDETESLLILSPTANVNTTMLSLRAYTNIFNHMQGREVINTHFSNFTAVVYPFIQPPSTPNTALLSYEKAAAAGATLNRNIHIAATTFFINHAILFILTAINYDPAATKKPETDLKDAQDRARDVCQRLTAFISDPKIVDSETIYRALVAIGTLVYEPKLLIFPRDGQKFTKAHVKRALDKVEKGSKEPRIRGAIDEIRALVE